MLVGDLGWFTLTTVICLNLVSVPTERKSPLT